MTERTLRIVTGRLLVVALVVGVVLAVANVPVAAVVARLPRTYETGWSWWDDAWSRGGARYYDVADGVRYQRKDGFMATEWEGKRRGPFSEELLRAYESRPSQREVASDPRPRYARLELVGERGEANVYAVGWPLVATFVTTTNGDSPDIRGTTMWEVRAFGRNWTIPYRVRWFGLVVNTVFYGALALALLTLGRWWRVRRRLKRGRCGACGYELGEGVGTCPECGLAAP